MPLVVVVAWLYSCAVPEENRDLAGRKFRLFTQNRKFCLGAQFLRKFATLRSAIFRTVRKFLKIFMFSR